MSHHGNVHHIKGISQQTKHPLRVVKSFMLYLFSILLHLLNCVCVCFSKKKKKKKKRMGNCSTLFKSMCYVMYSIICHTLS